MTAKAFFLLALFVGLVAFALWGIWPRKKIKPGPHNNWAQRGGSELFSSLSIVDREETALIVADSGHHGGLL